VIERAVIATTGGVLRLPNAELQMQRNKTAKARPQCATPRYSWKACSSAILRWCPAVRELWSRPQARSESSAPKQTFVRCTEAFGASGRRVDSVHKVPEAVAAALEHDALIEAPCPQVLPPW